MKYERGYAQHLGSRQEQQDAGLVLTDESRSEQLVMVADGMGGHAGGSIASAQVAATAKRLWTEHQKTPMEPKRLLERMVREGHEAINKAGAEKGLTPRSTCAILFVRNGSAYWAHVGDSRIYRLRDGQLARLTRDHSVVQMLVDLGKVSEDEMGTHPDQNRLTQSLGGDAAPMPDFGSDTVKAHDAFLVCSDGLWEMIPQPEMAAALAAKKLGDDGAKHLADRAFDRAKPKSDNITVALVRMGGPPPVTAGLDEARTTRLPPNMRRAAGGGTARWAFVAATVVGLAAAIVLIKPWEPHAPKGDAASQKEPPPAGTQPRKEEPKPETPPSPAPKIPDRSAVPPAPPAPPAQPPATVPPPAQPPATVPPPAQPPSAVPPPAQPPAQPPAAVPPPAQPPGAVPPPPPAAPGTPAQPGAPSQPQPGPKPSDGAPGGTPENAKPPGEPPKSEQPNPPTPQAAPKTDEETDARPGPTPPVGREEPPSDPPKQQ